MISEGIVTADEIKAMEEHKHTITLVLNSATNKHQAATIQVAKVRGPAYDVINNTLNWNTTACQSNKVNKKPFKYLSCAVRRAVKEYKAALRTGQWKTLTK
jgi:hypothetical protein